jgi:Apea-like HEPN
MATQPQTDAHAPPTGIQTERVLHDFVHDAVSNLSEALKDSVPQFEYGTRCERGADGNFREGKKLKRKLWFLNDEWFSSLPNYQKCIDGLKSDAIVGPHLDRLVGTSMSAFRLEAKSILSSLTYAMQDDEGHLVFSEELFHSKFLEWADFFRADRIAYKTVAPLPNLVTPAFPLRLNNELVLDRLTDDEVTRCCHVGVIRAVSPGFPLITGETTVGIRKIVHLPKLIMQGNEQHELPDAGDEGTFGNRPLLQEHLLIDDVLSALRLFKRAQIRAAGLANWNDSPKLGGVSYRVLGQWPYGGKLELSEDDVPHFLELWHLLEAGAANFPFSIHRFNLAFDRGLIADRIVDLVIAAEALLLSDTGNAQYRGELRYRFALRAAKFIDHPNYGEYDIFCVMRRAYDVRSAIVHGGSPSDTRLPGDLSASLLTFIDAIEELVRLGLRKALSMNEEGKKMRQAEYWDSLVLSKPNP